MFGTNEEKRKTKTAALLFIYGGLTMCQALCLGLDILCNTQSNHNT